MTKRDFINTVSENMPDQQRAGIAVTWQDWGNPEGAYIAEAYSQDTCMELMALGGTVHERLANGNWRFLIVRSTALFLKERLDPIALEALKDYGLGQNILDDVREARRMYRDQQKKTAEAKAAVEADPDNEGKQHAYAASLSDERLIRDEYRGRTTRRWRVVMSDDVLPILQDVLDGMADDVGFRINAERLNADRPVLLMVAEVARIEAEVNRRAKREAIRFRPVD